MPASQELKDSLWSQFNSETQSSFFQKIDAAFDANVTEPGGLTPEQKAIIVGVVQGVVDSHDADLATDVELKAALQAAVEAL